MKHLLSSMFALMATSSALKCGPGAVPDANNMCIQPKFIEGCYQYATE